MLAKLFIMGSRRWSGVWPYRDVVNTHNRIIPSYAYSDTQANVIADDGEANAFNSLIVLKKSREPSAEES